MRTTFRLKNPEAKKETVVFVDIVHATVRTKFYTPITLNPKYWDQQTERLRLPSTEKDDLTLEELEKAINLKLSDIEGLIKKYPLHCLKNDLVESADGLKKYLEAVIKPMNVKQSFVFLVDYIEKSYLPGCESGVITFLKDNQYRRYSKGTVKSKKGVLFALKAFEAERFRIRFEKVDMDFYDSFLKWSEGKGHKINQMGKVIKEIKTVMRYAYEQGIHHNTTWENRKFSVLREDITSVALSKNELDRLMALPLTGTEKYYRDAFLVGCYTALRISDYKEITLDQIKERDGYKIIELTTQKTKAPVKIPIASEIEPILSDPSFYGRSLIEQKLNYKIKELCKRAGINEIIEVVRNNRGMQTITRHEKHELVSSHTARRTGATYLYNIHGRTLDVMQITGHKSERAFLKYIKISSEEVAERMASKILNPGQRNLKVV